MLQSHWVSQNDCNSMLRSYLGAQNHCLSMLRSLLGHCSSMLLSHLGEQNHSSSMLRGHLGPQTDSSMHLLFSVCYSQRIYFRRVLLLKWSGSCNGVLCPAIGQHQNAACYFQRDLLFAHLVLKCRVYVYVFIYVYIYIYTYVCAMWLCYSPIGVAVLLAWFD